MFVFKGKVRCTHPANRRGQMYTVKFTVGLFPPYVNVEIEDSLYRTIHSIDNSRFNFQSRDSYADLLARDAWKSSWYDKYDGYLALVCPTLDRMPRRLDARIIASWDEPFVVIEFKLGPDYCQVCTRPRSGERGWKLVRSIHPDSAHLIPERPAQHEPSRSSTQVPDEQSDPSTVAPTEPESTLILSQNQLDDFSPLVIVPYSRASTNATYSEVEEVDTIESVRVDRNLSSVEAESTVGSLRDEDFPLEYPAEFPYEIDFDRGWSTSSVVLDKREKDGKMWKSS